MNVLLGHFHSESNEHSRQTLGFEEFMFKFGEASIEAMNVEDIFNESGINCIPSIYAHGHPGGPVTKDAFDFIISRYEYELRKNLHAIDGVFLYLHGASKVLGLDITSAEHAIIALTRKIVGPYMPIAVVMDPHGNLSKEFVEQANIVRCFRESPHTDAVETHRIVAKKFVDILKNRRAITPVYRKIPIIIGGERSVSADEPVRSINILLDEIEKDERILSASYHVGYLRHDSDKLGNSIVVVPSSDEFRDYAEEKARELAAFVWSKRDEFEFHNIALDPKEAIESVMEFAGSPVFLTDSGDNCGAGADGYNTYLLHRFMNLDEYNDKNILIAGIVDHDSFSSLYSKKINDHVSINLGMGFDELSKPIKIDGTISAIGLIHEKYEDKKELGTSITIKVDDKPISIVVLNISVSFYDLKQFSTCNLNVDDYDVIVNKQGYLAPEYIDIAKHYVMALTQGPTYQRSEKMKFKRIMRPMWPYDDFEYIPE